MSDIYYVIPKHNDEIYQNFILSSIKRFGGNHLTVTSDEGKNDSIFVKYQEGVKGIKDLNVPDDDIVVFVHEDVGIVDINFKEKLELIFKQNKNVGLVGVVGTTELQESGAWWMNEGYKLRGHLVQGDDNNKGFHLVKGPIGFFTDIVAIDGCFMATTGKIVKEIIKFDVDTFKDDNHFYDIDLSFQILEAGYDIAVADILIFHKSMGKGALKDEWFIAKDKFINKYKSKGYNFPISKDNFKNEINNSQDQL